MAKSPAEIAEAFQGLLGARDLALELARRPPGAPRTEEEAFLAFCHQHGHRSAAQLFQDLFVLHETGGKQGGFFVEFGATDGVELSNTLLLETGYQWRGILAEPGRTWHERLRRNRGCTLDTRCVWSRSGETLDFHETPWPEHSTVAAFSDSDWHASARAGGTHYGVPTVSLNDLLAEHGAPAEPDFLSVDTEGSELQILRAFDFARWRPRILTVEHNMTPARQKIHALLAAQGYERKFESFSRWDDWYVAR